MFKMEKIFLYKTAVKCDNIWGLFCVNNRGNTRRRLWAIVWWRLYFEFSTPSHHSPLQSWCTFETSVTKKRSRVQKRNNKKIQSLQNVCNLSADEGNKYSNRHEKNDVSLHTYIVTLSSCEFTWCTSWIANDHILVYFYIAKKEDNISEVLHF